MFVKTQEQLVGRFSAQKDKGLCKAYTVQWANMHRKVDGRMSCRHGDDIFQLCLLNYPLWNPKLCR